MCCQVSGPQVPEEIIPRSRELSKHDRQRNLHDQACESGSEKPLGPRLPQAPTPTGSWWPLEESVLVYFEERQLGEKKGLFCLHFQFTHPSLWEVRVGTQEEPEAENMEEWWFLGPLSLT